jgi:DNA-binding NarL/FixJ family response regulator
MITVTIVDDDAGVRESIASYINAAPDLKCISAYGMAQDAIQKIPADKPDVILMDINMPEMNGIECTRRLTAVFPSANILMLTVFEDSEKIFQALAAGAGGYLLKRSAPAKLLDAIREVYEGGSPMSAPIARKVVRSFQQAAEVGTKSEGLSPREEQVLDCLAKGYVYKQISDELGISIDTIRTYIRRIYDKLHVHSRTEAVAKYLGS